MRHPGGFTIDPAAATGIGEWDKLGGAVGEGGRATAVEVFAGNGGAVRVRPVETFRGALFTHWWG